MPPLSNLSRGINGAAPLKVCIPYGTTPGNYTGSFTLTAAKADAGKVVGAMNELGTAATAPLLTVPVSLEVWDIDLPRVNVWCTPLAHTHTP
jgi:hypothetical protein